MPKLVSQSEVRIEWTDLESWIQRPIPPSATVRSKGIHLSGVIRAVLQGMGKLDADNRTDEMPLVMAVGMAWENWVVGLKDMEGVTWQPGEWMRTAGPDDTPVYGTPDGFGPLVVSQLRDPKASLTSFRTLHTTCVEEFKFTLKSMRTRRDILQEKLWMWQLAGNCYAMETQYARLNVLWVCGDYAPPSPKYMRYVVRFLEEEMEEFWGNVVGKNLGLAKAEEGKGHP